MPKKKAMYYIHIQNQMSLTLTIDTIIIQPGRIALVPIYEEAVLKRVKQMHENGSIQIKSGLPNIAVVVDDSKPVVEEVVVEEVVVEEVVVEEVVVEEVAVEEVAVEEVVVEEVVVEEVAVEEVVVDVDGMTKEQIAAYATENGLDIVIGKRTTLDTARDRLKEALGIPLE